MTSCRPLDCHFKGMPSPGVPFLSNVFGVFLVCELSERTKVRMAEMSPLHCGRCLRMDYAFSKKMFLQL